MSTSGQVAGHAARRVLLITAAVLALAGILTGCTATVTTSAAPPSSTPPPVTAPSTPTTAPPAAPAAAANPWTPAVCSWAIDGLTEDSRLDRAAAASSPDPRFPGQTAASWTAYYTHLANQWDQVH